MAPPDADAVDDDALPPGFTALPFGGGESPSAAVGIRQPTRKRPKRPSQEEEDRRALSYERMYGTRGEKAGRGHGLVEQYWGVVRCVANPRMFMAVFPPEAAAHSGGGLMKARGVQVMQGSPSDVAFLVLTSFAPVSEGSMRRKGPFSTAENAARAFDCMALESAGSSQRGSLTRLNFPDTAGRTAVAPRWSCLPGCRGCRNHDGGPFASASPSLLPLLPESESLPKPPSPADHPPTVAVPIAPSAPPREVTPPHGAVGELFCFVFSYLLTFFFIADSASTYHQSGSSSSSSSSNSSDSGRDDRAMVHALLFGLSAAAASPPPLPRSSPPPSLSPSPRGVVEALRERLAKAEAAECAARSSSSAAAHAVAAAVDAAAAARAAEAAARGMQEGASDRLRAALANVESSRAAVEEAADAAAGCGRIHEEEALRMLLV